MAEWRAKFSPHTVYQYVHALRRVDRWLARETNSPPRKEGELPSPKPGPQRTVIATDEEIAVMLEKTALPLRVIILLCADCGLRAGEAARIAPCHFNREQGTITFRAKGGADQTTAVTRRIAELFALAQDTGEQITPYAARLAGRTNHNYMAVYLQWAAWKKKHGIRRELRMHDLRRTLATKAYNQTKDLRVPQQLLGHASLSSTVRYIAPFDAPKLKPLIEALKVPLRRKT